MVVLQKDNAFRAINARWLVWKCGKKKATSTIKYYHQGLSQRTSTYTVQVLSSGESQSVAMPGWISGAGLEVQEKSHNSGDL